MLALPIMATLGTFNQLRVTRESPHGLYLDGEELGEILLPQAYAIRDAREGSIVKVFVYRDSEDRLVATTERPLALVGDLAVLTVKSVNPDIGAFLDWGLQKDLLLPHKEQEVTVAEGDTVVVFVLLDPKSDRIYASTRLGDHLGKKPHEYKAGQPVKLVIARKTNLGHIAVVDDAHVGLLYANLTGSPVSPGDEVQGYIHQVRPDGKLDLTTESSGRHRVDFLSETIMQAVEAGGGRLEMNDSTAPEVIRERFGVSKKAFKQALGDLYRQRRIRFSGPAILSYTPQAREEEPAAPPPAPKGRPGIRNEPKSRAPERKPEPKKKKGWW